MKLLLRIMLLFIPLVFLSIPCYPQAAGRYITRKSKPAKKKATPQAKPKTNKATSAKSQAKKNTSPSQPSTTKATPRPQGPVAPTQGTSNYTPEVLTFTVNGVSFDMVEVRGGTFMMGATSEQHDADGDEKPVHQVTVSSFYMGKTEVTQALWKAVTGREPSYFKGSNRPVENVSWEDCQDFIAKLNRLTGMHFRLPTEAEWEFAARGGIKSFGTQFSGNNDLDEVAWYYNNNEGQTHDVATKRPNELGLYDMSGNVWEWCSDWYADYSSASQTNPTGPISGSERVLRGGSWCGNARYCYVFARDGYYPDARYYYIGLRLALP